MDIRIIRHERASAPTTRLFSFPHIGGGPAMFAGWAQVLRSPVELCVPLLPGRERAFDQAPFTDIEEMCAALRDAIAPLMDVPSVFFGDCFGGLVAFHLTHLLQGGGPRPEKLIVYGLGAPHVTTREEAGYPRSDALVGELREYLKRAGDTDPALLDDPDWMETLEPSIRGDLAVTESFHHQHGPPLSTPIAVIAEPQAKKVIDEFAAWAELTESAFSMRLLPSGPKHWKRLAEAVDREIAQPG
ncbi:hypothetical protein GCM10022226_68540 [Sphaerisporangium flaviroseum]|uniref:Thioesterase domain-containing protein n=1 Tax=Sphaerisporangium flaviroseum TaxID=509199 RepID=A0ABP7J8M8_9ACTN